MENTILEIEELLLDYGRSVSANEDNLELAEPLSKEIVEIAQSELLSTLRDEVIKLTEHEGMCPHTIREVLNLLNKP